MLFEARFFTTGWAFRIGLLQLRWNRQENYKALSLEWVKSAYELHGGLTWREFRLARKQQQDAALAARAEAEAKGLNKAG
jgi:hypothetical protein